MFAERPIKKLARDLRGDELRITIACPEEEVASAFAEIFHSARGVEVYACDLLRLPRDALVSPANSFGDMGGGFDAQIDRHYGGAAQPAVMERIREEFLGELPVGSATILEMKTRAFRYLVCAPTMRVPGYLGSSINAYLAMRAVLVEVWRQRHFYPIRTIAAPALCTGVGGMAATEAASQMLAAYRSVIEEGWREASHPALAPLALR